MAICWETELVLILRHLIDDLDGDSYSDSRLTELLIVAAELVQSTVDFANVYVIDPDSLSISPDPTQEPKDSGFILLVCYKAQCILRRGEFKTASRGGMRVSDGQSMIDTTAGIGASKALMDNACAEYDRAKFEYLTTKRVTGRAIIGPFSSPRVQTDYTGFDPRDRNRF